eukprot:Hpha_TRINITY_DN34861_c0_g1::TRINITY_DN34861_c0_g1_i1::g.167850::m.167850
MFGQCVLPASALLLSVYVAAAQSVGETGVPPPESLNAAEIGAWWDNYTVVPPPGNATVTLCRSPNLNDTAFGKELRKGDSFEGSPVGRYWLLVRGVQLYIPVAWAAGRELPDEWSVSQSAGAEFGNYHPSLECSNSYRELNVSGKGSLEAGLPQVDTPPGLDAVMVAFSRKCAAECVASSAQQSGGPCQRFTVFQSGRCQLAGGSCILQKTRDHTAITYDKIVYPPPPP